MNRVKKILGRFFVVLFASMAVANVAKAATSSTDVEITIEAPENITGENSETRNQEGDMESVQTGDAKSVALYVVGVVAALAAIVIRLFKKKKAGKKAFFAIVAILLSVGCMGYTSKAAEEAENVSVTIPTSISLKFEEGETTSISDFEVSNQSLVPITIDKVKVVECNDWKLVSQDESITVNTKKLAFAMEERCIQSGENALAITVPEESSKKINLQVGRGAWTESATTEKALELTFEYTLGKKEFQLTLDANGGSVSTSNITACNGETVTLPQAERDSYVFKGWQDEEGNLYTTEYVMPIGNVKLTAKWQETEAYAVYSADDNSLTFYRSETPIVAGTVYNEKAVTAVYTGFEDKSYTYPTIPWYSYRTQITSIEFHDKVSPISTEHWFRYMVKLTHVDGTNLDMSKVTNMQLMFYEAGREVSEVYFTGLEDWDVSNVTNMFSLFEYVGYTAKTVHIGDLSKWDVSSVTIMTRTFALTGAVATDLHLCGMEKWDVSNVIYMNYMFYYTGHADLSWSIDLTGWNVTNAIYHSDFNKCVETKVKQPKWS